MRISNSHPRHALIFAALAAALVTGCGKKSADATADSAAVQSDSTPTAAAATTQSASATAPATAASLTADDMDRWQRGMDAEMKAVQDVPAQMKSAKTSDDSLNALNAANESSTLAAGAKAAGVDEQRYQLISSTLSSLAANMTPVDSEMDMSKMPAAMATSMNQARQKALVAASAGIAPDLLTALKPRAVALRKQALALAGARLKAVGAVQ
jgi:hypothetical protein